MTDVTCLAGGSCSTRMESCAAGFPGDMHMGRLRHKWSVRPVALGPIEVHLEMDEALRLKSLKNDDLKEASRKNAHSPVQAILTAQV